MGKWLSKFRRWEKNSIKESEAYKVGKRSLDKFADNQSRIKYLVSKMCSGCKRKARKAVVKRKDVGEPCDACRPYHEEAVKIGMGMNFEELVKDD